MVENIFKLIETYVKQIKTNSNKFVIVHNSIKRILNILELISNKFV